MGLQDALAHVTDWWAEGQRTVENFVANPDFASPDNDEDAFNAQAVAQYAEMSEDAVIEAFEKRRAQWTVLILGLSDVAFADPKIAVINVRSTGRDLRCSQQSRAEDAKRISRRQGWINDASDSKTDLHSDAPTL